MKNTDLLFQPIETPDGETNAYEIIYNFLESKADDFYTQPCDAEMYSAALSHFKQLMEDK